MNVVAQEAQCMMGIWWIRTGVTGRGPIIGFKRLLVGNIKCS